MSDKKCDCCREAVGGWHNDNCVYIGQVLQGSATPPAMNAASPTDADKMLAMRAEYDRQHAAKRGMLAGQGSATSGEAAGIKTWRERLGVCWAQASYMTRCASMESEIGDLRAALAAKAEQSSTAVPRVGGNTCPECGGSLSTWKCTCTPIWPGYFAAPVAERAAAPASVPEGYKLVPINPDDNMVQAGAYALPAYYVQHAQAVYHAMIAAAPEAAQPAVQGERAAPSEKAREPVMADGVTPLSDYLENTMSDAEIGDEWTKGYEECKRRLFGIVGHQLRATPAPRTGEPSADATDAARYRYIEEHASACGGGNGFKINCWVPVDCEDMGCGIDSASKATQGGEEGA